MNVIDGEYMERHYHLSWGKGWARSSRYSLPILAPESFIPNRVVPFDKINKTDDMSACVIFNLSDRRIDRFWNMPEAYFKRLKQFDCVTTPDFSLLLDMERPFIEGNVLRSLKLGRKMQELGMRVIPCAMWAYPDTYDVCFEALPKRSIVFVSSVGSIRKSESFKYFKLGLQTMLERVDPSGVILYGPVPRLDFDVPVVRHFDRVFPACFNAYQPDLFGTQTERI